MSGKILLPIAFQKNMQAILGPEFAAFTEAIQGETPVSIQVNPNKLIDLPYSQQPIPWYSRGYYLEKRPVFTLDPAFHGGAYYVQEASSMFVAEVARQQLELDQPLKVLDACAAPGGKTSLLASILSKESILLSNEVIKNRYPSLRYNVYRWGQANTATSNHDLKDFALLEGYFDLVLVDAPCSGEGMFRKDPMAIQEWSAEHVEFCSLRQRRITNDAIRLVKPGGLLIYSTCTYNYQENQETVKSILKQGDFELAQIDVQEDWGIQALPYGFQFFPHRLKGEGFFLAALRKRSGTSPKASKIKEFNRIDRVSKKEAMLADDLLASPKDYRFYKTKKGQWRAFHKAHLEDWQRIAEVLPRFEAGIPIGEPKGKDLVPAPELALYNDLSTLIPRIALDKTTSLHYLKKEAISINPQTPKGRLLVTYQGLGLGWLKNLGNRINNNYPKQWRIRMDIPAAD